MSGHKHARPSKDKRRAAAAAAAASRRTPPVARRLPVDGCVADAGDGGEDPRPVDLLLGLLAVSGTLDDELREVDLSGSDITLDGWDDCRGERWTSNSV